MRNESGVTFYELVVVVGIMALLSSMAIPGFLSWLPKYKMSSAADEVLSTLQHAKLRAIRENDFVSVTFNTANDSYTAFLDNGAGGGIAGNGQQDGVEVTVKNGQMPEGIGLLSTSFVDFGGDVVRFNSRGFPFAGGNIVVANGAGTRTISLTLGGSSWIP